MANDTKNITRISFPRYMEQMLSPYIKAGVVYTPTITKTNDGVVVIELREEEHDGNDDNSYC